jgi:hypothetical protein
MLVAPTAIGQGGEDDPLVEVRRRDWRGQGPEQRDEPGRSAELRRARGADAEVAAQDMAGAGGQFVEEEGIDQAARGRTVKRLTRIDWLHTLLMTRPLRKVAARANVAA